MTLYKRSASQVATTEMSLRQRISLRRTAYLSAFSAIPVFVVVLTVGGTFFYPDDNSAGKPILRYCCTTHRVPEIQSILWVYMTYATAALVVNLGRIYEQRSGEKSLTQVMIFGNMVAWIATQFVVLGIDNVIAVMGRGYPGFGTGALAPLATLLWNLVNVVLTWCAIPLAVALLGVGVANRADPILGHAVGHAAMIAGTFSIIVSMVSVFIDTGRFSAGSAYSFYLEDGPLLLWITVTGMLLIWRSNGRS